MPSEHAGAVIRAAGGVLWRPSRRHGIRVALVHRPRYDDWSLPKGKAEPGEVPPVTAAREVQEETGFSVAIGRSLTTVSYRVATGAKTVQYFSARMRTGEFTPNKEVDRLDWLPVGKAVDRMTYDFDRAVLTTLAVAPAVLPGVVLVQHGRAGQREAYDGDDRQRPLDAKGSRQAAALATELAVFAPTAVISAPLKRCKDTVGPLARSLELPIGTEALLAEDTYRDDPAGARVLLLTLANAQPDAGALVAASQGGVIPGVVKSLAARSDVPIGSVGTPKGAYWYLCFDGNRLVQADPYPAPAV